MNASRAWQLLVAAAVALAATPALALALEWSLVAKSGDAAPPVPGPHLFDTLANVSVRADGTVYFSNTGSNGSDPAIYRWRAATGVELLARLDLPVASLGDPAYSTQSGFLAIGTQSKGPPIVDLAATLDACPDSELEQEVTFAVSEAGDLVPLTSPAAPVPGFDAGWIFGWGQAASVGPSGYPPNYVDIPAVNANGELAFFAGAVRADVCTGFGLDPYANAVFGPDGSGATTLVAVAQQLAPGTPAGSVLIPMGDLELNDLGDVAFNADILLGPSWPVVPAIYRWNATGGLTLVARSGGLAPGGGTFSSADDIPFKLGDGGHLVFHDIDGFFFSNEFLGIYVHDEIDGLRAVVQRGDTLPGLPVSYHARATTGYAVNALGEVAFSMQVEQSPSGATRTGIWGPNAAGNTAIRLIDGGLAPDLGSARIERLRVLAVSDEREILFEAELSSGSFALYLVDGDGQYRLLLRDGDPGALGPGIPVALALRRLQWDADLRHFAALLVDDADGLVIASTEIPEPGALLAGLASIASLTALRGRAGR